MASPDWNIGANRSDGFGQKGRLVTPAATDLDPIAKSVVMLATGNITVLPINNAVTDLITFTGVPAGFVVPYFIRRVTACSSSCATID